ncbi:MAG: sigma-54 dependent transcriptional regulator [Lentisphaeraceae bacterium]|nr:sigma-54 dependent transcriptional regulator [Lentisphaeraceae bacterium]
MEQTDLSKNVDILLVDDDEAIRDSLGFYLENSGWKIKAVESPIEALELIKEGFGDIIISDIKMPQMDGLTFLGKAKQVNPDLEVLMITGHSNEALAIEALKNGAFDYFRKPLNAEEIITSLHRTRKYQRLKEENKKLQTILEGYNSEELPTFFGESPKGQDLLKQIQRAASVDDATILLNGESGVGKEVISKMIHNLSRSKSKPFMALNCGGLAENILESELFGHERGSFTGADKQKAGIFELGMGGTVLLDEISEMSLHAQSRFLRVLEERTFRRVGGAKEISFAGTRIIAATNKDLEQQVSEEKFRHDLYHRINIVTINIPPLRERVGDIVPLCRYFLADLNRKRGKEFSLVKSAENALMKYEFPGNIRELRNMLDRATIFAQTDKLTAQDLGLVAELEEADLGDGVALPDNLNLQDHEMMLIRAAMQKNTGNHSATARSLGITPQALYRKMEKYGIE